MGTRCKGFKCFKSSYFVSDKYETLYPYTANAQNEGGTNLLTARQLEEGQYDVDKISAPPVDSVTTVDILRSLHAEQVILKLDVEGFECQVTKVLRTTSLLLT